MARWPSIFLPSHYCHIPISTSSHRQYISSKITNVVIVGFGSDLVGFFILATSNVISGWGLTYDSTHS